MPAPLRRSTRRLVLLLVFVPLLVCVLGTLYMLGMNYLEHSPRGFLRSLEWASETLTTTGYGADSTWHHPLMYLLVIATQLLGISILVLVFPLYVLPYLEEQFEARLPRTLPSMHGRVLIQGYSAAVDTLVTELRREGVGLVILEQDDAAARSLRDRGYDVVAGNLEEQPDLLAGVAKARALVTNGDDHTGASFIMMAREYGFSGPMLALCADPLHRAPMEQIGASAVFTPSHVLAAALAARASTRISPRHEGLRMVGDYLDLGEFRVRADSPFAGRRLGELELRERYAVTLLGQYVGGRFLQVEGPATRIVPGAILVAVGSQESLQRIEQLATPVNRHGPIVVAGYGAVGQKVVEMLREAGEETVVIDEVMAEGVDVVGNVLERSTLDRADVLNAKVMILALSNDSAGVFAAAVVRDYDGNVPLIARVNRGPNVARLYTVGADFALSIGEVAGQIIAHHVLERVDLVLEDQLKFVRVAPGRLVGMHPWQAQAREKTGAAIVAVQRGSDVVVNFKPDFVLAEEDAVFICGSAPSLDRYFDEFETATVAAPLQH